MPVWTDTHDETDPADTDQISDGARELRQDVKRIFRERLNDLLTDGDAPIPPTTLVNTDTRIGPGNGGLTAPAVETADTKMISGDRVDLRGCPQRTLSPASDFAVRTIAGGTTTWSPIGNPGGAEGTGAFALTRTPVSDKSQLIFCLSGLAVISGTASLDTFVGMIRIKNMTDGTVLVPGWTLRIMDSDEPSNNTFGNFMLITAINGVSGLKRYEPQFTTGGGAGCVFSVRGDLQTTHFRIIELV